MHEDSNENRYIRLEAPHIKMNPPIEMLQSTHDKYVSLPGPVSYSEQNAAPLLAPYKTGRSYVQRLSAIIARPVEKLAGCVTPARS
jgi:hypothetical protein